MELPSNERNPSILGKMCTGRESINIQLQALSIHIMEHKMYLIEHESHPSFHFTIN